MPAWNPQQLEYSAEEDEGEPEHRRYDQRQPGQQEYGVADQWGQEPGYHHQGQSQGRGGYDGYSSAEEEGSQWSGQGAYGQQHAQQQQGYQQQQPPQASAYETFQMPSASFNDDDDDGYAGGAGAGEFFGNGEMDIPISDELRAAMSGYSYTPAQGQGQGEYSPRREAEEMKKREEAVRREQQEFEFHAQAQQQNQQQQPRKGVPIKNTARKNSDFGREDTTTKKGASGPGSLKSGSSVDALNSSTNTLHGGVMNKTPTTTSPLASFIPSKLGFGSLWGAGGRAGEQAPAEKRVEEDGGLSEEEEEQEDDSGEEEEEERGGRGGGGGWFGGQSQKKQAPAPPAKKAAPPPPPPAPAPAPTTAKGRKAARAQAAAEAKAKAEEEARVAAAAAKAAEEAEAARKADEAAKEKEAKAAAALAAAAPPVPEKTTGKKGKKGKQAVGKRGGSAKSEPVPPPPAPAPVEEKKKPSVSSTNAKENNQVGDQAKKGTSSLSSSVLSTGSEGGWGEASSTPRPSAASIKAQAGWGEKAQQQQPDVLGASGMLRKAVMHQVQHKQEANGASGKGNGGPTIDTSPLPDDLRASLWSRATSRTADTPVSATTPTAASTPTAATSSGWKLGGSKARRGSDGAANPLQPPTPQGGFAKVSGSTRKARNGLSSAPKTVTLEEVSDEEADAPVEGSLGVESRYLLESTEEILRRQQQEIAHPRPSMPPSSYNNFFGNDHYDEGFASSANGSYVPQTPSTAPTSPPDDVPPMSNEELFSNAAKGLKTQKASNGHSSSASGFASDWDATVKQRRPRWSTTTSGMRPASSATVGPGASGPAQSAFRYQSSLASPPMAAPTLSSESDDPIPGGFPSASRGNMAGGGTGSGNGSLMSAREKMRAAAAAGGGRAVNSTSNVPSNFGAGGRQPVDASSVDNTLLERFMQGQRQEEMKRAAAKIF
jgi:hypothetical protein